MKERVLRLWHRRIGVITFIFLLLQAATGVLLAVEELVDAYWGPIYDLHGGYNIAAEIYRVVIGLGLLWMLLSGIWIYGKIRSRTRS